MKPQIETSDNAFKIILPNMNAGPDTKNFKSMESENSGTEENVMALVEEQGSVTRKEVEKLLGIGQTTCGRLLKQMIENGQIIQEGRGKNTHYCLPK